MSENLVPKITTFKTSKDLMAEVTVHPGNHVYHGLADYVKRGFQNAGYLLSWDIDDIRKDLFTVTVFENMATGHIFYKTFNEVPALEDAIDSLVTLNDHAEYVDYTLGYDGDDFVKNWVSIKVNFRFKP